MNIKEIKSAIVGIKRSSSNLVGAIQRVSVGVATHAEKHGDITLATKLVNACAGSVRKQALIAYLSDHTPMNWNKTDNCFTLPKNKDKRRSYLIDEMVKVLWTEYTTEPEVKPLDIQKRIDALVKSFDKAKDVNRETVNTKNMDKLRELATS
tara:strand:+ start:1600 stop:2055 length:456 start_codon:yes stop_codon:yes gene_type:complete